MLFAFLPAYYSLSKTSKNDSAGKSLILKVTSVPAWTLNPLQSHGGHSAVFAALMINAQNLSQWGKTKYII